MDSSPAAQFRVGVVGFGVAGATAAYLLARAGHDVCLFERAPQVGPVGAGILLQPAGQAVLRQLGLLDRAVRQAEPINELHALNHHGRTLMRLPYAEIEPGCQAYGLHRGELFEALHEAVLAERVRIFLGHDIHTYRVEKGKAFLGDTAAGRHGPFDFVLAADGSRSNLRGRCGLASAAYHYAHGALWATGQCSAVKRKLHQVTRGTRNLLGLLPMGGGRCSLFWSQRRDQYGPLKKAGFAAWRDEVLQLCPLAEELFNGLTSFDSLAFTTYQHVWMRQWHDSQILFLGDAAHAMSPHLGQGVNLALLDAYCFAQALAHTGNFRRACRIYTQQRSSHLRYYALVTALLTPFFQSGGWIKAWSRDLALPLMPRIPWVRRQMLLTMAGLKGGFFRGRLPSLDG